MRDRGRCPGRHCDCVAGGRDEPVDGIGPGYREGRASCVRHGHATGLIWRSHRGAVGQRGRREAEAGSGPGGRESEGDGHLLGDSTARDGRSSTVGAGGESGGRGRVRDRGRCPWRIIVTVSPEVATSQLMESAQVTVRAVLPVFVTVTLPDLFGDPTVAL